MPKTYVARLRRLLSLAALCPGLLLPLASAPANAQSYPSKPVRIVVTFAPGGTVDVFARIVSERLTQRLGQNFYVENVAGATGNIGTAQAAKAAPDGHTVLFAFSSHVVNPSLFANLPYDPVKDFEPVSLAVSSTHVVTVTPSVPAKSVAELVALIRANPAKYNFASGGTGTQAHLLGEQFHLAQKLDLVHVPFNGSGPAIASVVGGHTPIGFTTLATAAQQIAAGQVRALAVTSKARAKIAPDVPTMGEAGFPEIVGDIWVGVMLPAKTPKEIVATLNAAVVAVLADPAVQDRLGAVGFEPIGSTPEAFARQIAAELDGWRKIIQAANLKVQ